MFNFTSSAIDSISTEGDNINITFAGGREYSYTTEDVSKFTADLTNVITNEESVGKFVNSMMKQNVLQTA